MAERSTIARPYAEALFTSAQAAQAAGAWLAPVEQLAQLAAHPQVAAVVGDPKLSAAQIYDLIAGLAGQALPAGVANFLRLVVDNGRIDVLPEVAQQYRQLKNAAEGQADCLIESAFPLSDAQVADLVAMLKKKFPLRLQPVVKVDAALIGGVRVTVGDQVLDSSIRAQLNAMRSALTV